MWIKLTTDHIGCWRHNTYWLWENGDLKMLYRASPGGSIDYVGELSTFPKEGAPRDWPEEVKEAQGNAWAGSR